jgi:L-asparaginase/Glu-tRNA(Gln) amidotransferase subunit D
MTRLPRLLALFALLALIASPSISGAQNNLPVCPLIATGGTIAMKIDPVKKACVGSAGEEDGHGEGIGLAGVSSCNRR